ncbi:hypothetical protein TNCV_3322201 [Trichonephila clavipes]|nr:hypothetical protein TNCV_3322201 [Trichonephila clavipes]
MSSAGYSSNRVQCIGSGGRHPFWHGRRVVNVCRDDALGSSGGQGNFRLNRLGFLLGSLIVCVIAGDPNRTVYIDPKVFGERHMFKRKSFIFQVLLGRQREELGNCLLNTDFHFVDVGLCCKIK